MKILTVYSGEKKIEFSQSVFGKETVRVNSEAVSSKISIGSTKHEFSIIENGEETNCKISTGNGVFVNRVEFYKNNKLEVAISPLKVLPLILAAWLMLMFLEYLGGIIGELALSIYHNAGN